MNSIKTEIELAVKKANPKWEKYHVGKIVETDNSYITGMINQNGESVIGSTVEISKKDFSVKKYFPKMENIPKNRIVKFKSR